MFELFRLTCLLVEINLAVAGIICINPLAPALLLAVISNSSAFRFKLNVNRTPDGGSAASHTLRYASGTGTNELIFSLAIAGGSPVAADDSFAVTAQNLVKAGATTCRDAGTALDSEVEITSAQATACGTIVATA